MKKHYPYILCPMCNKSPDVRVKRTDASYEATCKCGLLSANYLSKPLMELEYNLLNKEFAIFYCLYYFDNTTQLAFNYVNPITIDFNPINKTMQELESESSKIYKLQIL